MLPFNSSFFTCDCQVQTIERVNLICRLLAIGTPVGNHNVKKILFSGKKIQLAIRTPVGKWTYKKHGYIMAANWRFDR